LKYFKEGIDRIAVKLSNIYFKKENVNRHKDPYNRLTLHPAGEYYILSIHAEWFIPTFDYQMQIAMAIYELIKEGVIEYPDNIFTPYFVFNYYAAFIESVVGIEFYSDFRKENIEIDNDKVKPTIDEAKDGKGLYQYFDKKEHRLTDTCYSPDKNGSRKSQVIIYNKLEKLKKENNHRPELLSWHNENPIRLEFKVFANNSIWLHWHNLRGTYQEIFNRYKDYLAVVYNNQINGCVTIRGDENPNFQRIVNIAKKNHMIRFRNKRDLLKKKTGQMKYEHNDDGMDEARETIEEIFELFGKKPSIMRATGIFNGKVSRMYEECGRKYGFTRSGVENSEI